MPDEARLIRQAQKGDAQACGVLYDRHYDAVYRYCYYRLGDGHTAQDVTGEVFVRMVEKLDTFRPRGRPLLATGELAQKILSEVQEYSEGFGTEIEIRDGVGVVRVR